VRWGSDVSENADLESAVAETSDAVEAALGGTADLVVAFVSEHHAKGYPDLPALVEERFPNAILLGCSAGGVIGGGREVERRPGLSLTGASLPDVEIHPFALETEDIPPLEEDPRLWAELVKVSPTEDPHFILLPDPHSFDADAFLRGLDRHFPVSRKVGGLASAGRETPVNALFLGREAHFSGLVGVALAGNVTVDTIVAQGCRPIGAPVFITRAERNVILELDGRNPSEVIQELYKSLPPDDQELFRHSLFLGIVMQEAQKEYRQGDFLIRNLIGLDPQKGFLAVGALLKENTVVQFHLRDARTSEEDLDHLLRRYREEGPGRPGGSLLFSCLGRGLNLYGAPDHDTNLFKKHLGAVPLGGFFCNGEIGPVHGRTFLHGYTSSFGIFRSKKSMVY
jgi:small ligand-binding sensory domain FIST